MADMARTEVLNRPKSSGERGVTRAALEENRENEGTTDARIDEKKKIALKCLNTDN